MAEELTIDPDNRPTAIGVVALIFAHAMLNNPAMMESKEDIEAAPSHFTGVAFDLAERFIAEFERRAVKAGSES